MNKAKLRAAVRKVLHGPYVSLEATTNAVMKVIEAERPATDEARVDDALNRIDRVLLEKGVLASSDPHWKINYVRPILRGLLGAQPQRPVVSKSELRDCEIYLEGDEVDDIRMVDWPMTKAGIVALFRAKGFTVTDG